MFVAAIEKAKDFTFPLIISNRYQNGSISSSLGSFIILNEEGWILTAAHMVQDTILHHAHVEEYANYIKGEGTVLNPKWILQHSLWFGSDHHRIEKFHIFSENDIAIGRIANYDADFTKTYPQFVRPDQIKAGRSVCKLGFPFYDIQASYANNAFHYSPQLFPIPQFPLEGMVTRILHGSNTNQGEVLWVETSSPGLRGQSGGPLFDVRGHIWGMQSMTRHLPLGFSPSINKNGLTVEENQFINLGWCTHVKSILAFLDQHNVRYYLAEEKR